MQSTAQVHPKNDLDAGPPVTSDAEVAVTRSKPD
jgi:hypothetical protein